MKINALATSAFAAFLIAAGAYNSQAQSVAPANDVPRAISYQGNLADNAGKALPDGNYRITLSLYADPAGSVKVWQDTYDAPVINGIFNLYLGAGSNPLPDPAKLNAALWIGTQVGDAPLMHPLTPLSASPYALNVPDRAITTGKLADGAVTADKVDMEYIGGIAVNGQPVTAKGTVLNLEGSDDIAIDFDNRTNTLRLSRPTPAAEGDREKSAEVQGSTFDFWTMRGNGRTDNGGTVTPVAGDWIGTSNSVGFEMRTNNQRVMYYQPNGTSTPNIVGGYSGNTISASSIGSIIAGGGDAGSINEINNDAEHSVIGGGLSNLVSENYSVIAGGQYNTVDLNSTGGTVGGGYLNRIWSTSTYNTISGGSLNSAHSGSDYSSIGGGQDNKVGNPGISAADWGTVGGGLANSVEANYGTVGGGTANKVLASTGTVAGGEKNEVNQNFGAIGGGFLNDVSGWSSTIGGGERNTISRNYATIGGGYGNTASADLATVAGGDLNQARGLGTFVGGGFNNDAFGAQASIAGGEWNFAQAKYSAIGGGNNHAATGEFSAIPGGDHLLTTGYAQTSIGYYNIPRGTLTGPLSAATTAITDAPLFMIGNGDGTVLPPARSNAFEVSYNGHSVVYDVNGYIRTPIRGATYVDNILYAWGSVNANGGINIGSEFGVVSVAHIPGSGVYDVRIAVNDPQTGAPVILTKSSVTANIRDDGPETFCGLITVSEVGTPGANQFRVRIRDVQCQPHDAPFMFKVTGRP